MEGLDKIIEINRKISHFEDEMEGVKKLRTQFASEVGKIMGGPTKSPKKDDVYDTKDVSQIHAGSREMGFLVDLGYKKEEILDTNADKNSSLRDRLALIQQKKYCGTGPTIRNPVALVSCGHVHSYDVALQIKKCTVCMKENKAFKRIIIAIF